MREVFVADIGHFAGQPRKVIAEGDVEIGVFKVGEEYYAWENACPHQGGPVCQGKIMSWVEEQLDEGKRALGQRFAEDTLHVVCPWHGFEFDLRTGRHPGDFPTRLKGYETRVREGKVYVLLD